MYNAAISTCARASKWQWSLWILAYMRESADLPSPNAISYNAAIKACERRGLWEQALCLLDSFPHSQLQFTSLNCAMSACEKGQQWQAALFLMSRFSHFSCQPTLVTYGAASAACAVSQSWETALELLSAMRVNSIPPSRELLNCLAEVCRKSWAWQQALGLLQMGLGSFRQQVALHHALEASQARTPGASIRRPSTLELRWLSLSAERFLWRGSRPVAASAQWLSVACDFPTDCIRQSLEQRNGFGSCWHGQKHTRYLGISAKLSTAPGQLV